MPDPAEGLDPTALVRQWLPDIAIESVRRLEGGWMNDVFGLE